MGKTDKKLWPITYGAQWTTGENTFCKENKLMLMTNLCVNVTLPVPVNMHFLSLFVNYFRWYFIYFWFINYHHICQKPWSETVNSHEQYDRYGFLNGWFQRPTGMSHVLANASTLLTLQITKLWLFLFLILNVSFIK